jgi:hypothetical protein
MPFSSLSKELAKNLSDTLFGQLKCNVDTHVMIIYDQQSPLSKIITQGYEDVLLPHPAKTFLDFDAYKPEELMEKMDDLSPNDCVVLVQSFSFRVSVYRWRLELFARKLKVVEHVRLSYMTTPQFPTYIRSLRDDSAFVQPAAHYLSKKIRETTKIRVECMGGSVLTYDSKMEPPTVNDGDYSKDENKGGGYPIGEIFSESMDISKVNGEVEIYAFPGKDHKMRFAKKSFRICIENGFAVAGEYPPEFQPLVDMMKTENPDGKIPIREFGLGLNRAITQNNPLTEATAFERVTGLHVSMGMKHGVYQKKFKKNKELIQRYHVDVYPDVKRIWMDDTIVFEDGRFIIS